MNTFLAYFLGYAIPVGGLLVLMVAGLFAVGVALEAEARWRRHALPVVFAIMLLAIGVGSAMSGRNVASADANMFAHTFASASSFNTWFLRACTGTVLVVAVACIMATLFRGDYRNRPRQNLYYAFVAYFVCNNIVNAALGSHPGFNLTAFYSLLLFTLVYVSHRESPAAALDAARSGLILFFAGSFAAAAIAPDIALQRDYLGVLPGLHIRFWGLGSNPNSIGPLAAVGIMLLMLRPFSRRWLQCAAQATCVAVLLLSQSKTAWGGLLVALLAVLCYRQLAANGGSAGRRDFLIGLLSAACFGLAGVITFIWLGDVGGWADRALSTREGMEAATLTGRSKIWQIALDMWADNPFFGYGPSAWDTEHRFNLRINFAFSAHNQWLQSLGGAGLFGLASLLLYQGYLWVAAWRARQATGGVSLALVAFLLVRCISETPLETRTLLNGDLVTHAIFFLLLLHYGARPAAAPRPATPAPARFPSFAMR